MKYINIADLHVHTNASDGACTVAEIARMAREEGLEIVAVTDHDTISALESVPQGLNIEIVPGVELSAELAAREVHILGYFVDVACERLKTTLSLLREKRRDRMRGILDKLSALNVKIEPQGILDMDDDSSVGRLHVAELLIDEGYAANVYEAFRDYLGPCGKAFVPKARPSVAEAIELVHAAGSAAVLAHPGSFFTTDEVRTFVEEGLDGIEAYYPAHAPFDTDRWAGLAKELDLIATAGSDFHGRGNEIQLGAMRATRECVEALRTRSRRYAAGRLS